jgi:predicted PurR-regulated permease PerM
MNEGLVFIAIMAATILEGIMGALLIVPVLATAAVIGEYIRRRVLGLPAFDESAEMQFIKPAEEQKPIRRKRKKDKNQ